MSLGRIRDLFCLIAISATVFALPSLLSAMDIVSVEEHWELRLGQPDANSSAPQVTMTMSPTDDLANRYFVFTLNHHSVPDYVPGGMQVQCWNGDAIECSRDGAQESALCHDGELVSWVQRIQLDEGQLSFEIVTGNSQSWGNFGGCDLKIQDASSLPNLNDYKPGISITDSGVGYAGNRVSSLTLTRLVWTTAEGDTYELTAPIDVDTDLDP